MKNEGEDTSQRGKRPGRCLFCGRFTKGRFCNETCRNRYYWIHRKMRDRRIRETGKLFRDLEDYQEAGNVMTLMRENLNGGGRRDG